MKHRYQTREGGVVVLNRETVQDFRAQYAVRDAQEKEVISYSLWNRLTYVSGTTRQLVFFQTAGSPPATNLESVPLPAGYYFLIQAARLAVLQPTTETATAAAAAGTADGALQNVFQLCSNGTLTLKVGDKTFGQWPGWMWPQGGGPNGQLSVPGTAAAGSSQQYMSAVNGTFDPRGVYTFPIPISIPALYQFKVFADWATPETLFNAANVDLMVVLDGQLMRPRQ